MLQSGRPTALVIHGIPDIVDLLTRRFELAGLDVLTGLTAFRAQAHLEGERPIDVVVAPWDTSHPIGGETYRWVLQHRPDLRNRFVFIADEVPPEFDAVVGGRCLAVPLSAIHELTRVAIAIVWRVRTPPQGVPAIRGHGRPTLLLADDDPLLLDAMAHLLTDQGYYVTQTDSGNHAIEELEVLEFDTIVVDWHMHDGSGADVYRWVMTHRPHLAARVVFLTAADQDDTGPVAPGRPMFRKGQDAAALSEMLREIVAAVRG